MKRYNGLNLLYPPFKARLKLALDEIREAGIPMQVFETFRTRDRQSNLYSYGRGPGGDVINRSKIVTWVRPGGSYHNYGLAADCVLWINGKWSWSETYYYRKAGPIFEKYGLKWLGRTTCDLVHVQLQLPINIKEVGSLYDRYGLEGVWMHLDSMDVN